MLCPACRLDTAHKTPAFLAPPTCQLLLSVVITSTHPAQHLLTSGGCPTRKVNTDYQEPQGTGDLDSSLQTCGGSAALGPTKTLLWLTCSLSTSQFGGSPVSCAVGLAVLEVLEKEQLQAHATCVGSFLMDLLRQQQAKHAIIGDVR